MATRIPQDDYQKTALRLPRDLHARVSQSADAAGRSMNAEIIARLQDSFSTTPLAPVDMTVLGVAIEEQKRLSEVYRMILVRVGRIIEAVGRDIPVDAEAIRAIEGVMFVIGDRLRRGDLSTVSYALHQADEISTAFAIAKARLAYLEGLSADASKLQEKPQ